MRTFIAFALPLALLILTLPWCLRMLRTTSAEPPLNRIGQLVSMTAAAGMGALFVRMGITPAWTWYPVALAVGVGACALSLRWTTLIRSGPPERKILTVVSLVVEAALLVLVLYGFLR